MFDSYHDGIYILGVSGGPDSMAMLHMAVKAKLQIAVCHVNYHQRKSSDYDESVVRSFCAQYGIPLHVHHAAVTYEGNFQDYARRLRFEFFKTVYRQYDARGLMLAHHRDDDLETALLRKKQGRKVMYYGIQGETQIEGMRVIRPLLSFWKIELQKYCDENKIPYGIDESNQKDRYERNRIRNQILAKMTWEEKNLLHQKIQKENEMLKDKQTACFCILEQLEYKEQLPVHLLEQCNDPLMLIRLWLSSLHKQSFSLSEKTIKQILAVASTQYGEKEVPLSDGYAVQRRYGRLHFIKQTESDGYSFLLHQIEELDTPWFKVRLDGRLRDGITVCDDDFPLTIRNVQPGDTIHLSFGHKKLHRYFIDQKIPRSERKMWPVVCNRHNEVIFVCGLGSSSEYFTNTPNLFVVK